MGPAGRRPDDPLRGPVTGEPVAARPRTVARSGASLLVGTLFSNLLSYAFFAVLSRTITTSDLGAVGSIINVSVLASVPALGLQLVAARMVARAAAGDRTHGLSASALVRFSLLLSTVLVVLLVMATPFVAQILDVDRAVVVVLAASLVPMTLTYLLQGVLQGHERFAALAVVLSAAGVAKFLAATVATALSAGVLGIIGLFAGGWLVVAALALALTRPSWALLARDTPESSVHDHVPRWTTTTDQLARSVALAVVPTSGLFFLSSIDVILARVHLSPDDSGEYLIGALFTKAAFWGMSFLATLFYPGMAQHHRRRWALTRALGITVLIGASGVVASAVLGGPLATLVGGQGYASVGPLLWRFTALGVCLSLVQVLAYAGVARASAPMGVAMWGASAVAVLGVARWHASIVDVVTVLLVVAAGLVLAGLAIEGRSLARADTDS